MPRLEQRRAAKPCQGVDVVEDLRQAPLQPCAAQAIPGERFCKRHERERDRQLRLLSVLKKGWQTTVQAKRGRHADSERASAAVQAEKALADLPPVEHRRNPADAWPKEARPAPKPAPADKLTGALPSLDAARRKLTGTLDGK